MRPFDSQTRSEMSHCSFSGIVRSLRLRHIHDCARHAANHDNASWRISLHKMLGYSHSIKIGTVDIDSPELLHTVVWVGDSIVVFGEPSRRYKVVNLPMRF